MSDRPDRIVGAALRVIARSGVDAATHRAVAAEAGVPLASTTYHFASKADIVRDALERVIERSMAAVDRAAGPPPPGGPDALVDRLVELVCALQADDRAPLAAQYELMLEAGRRPHLRTLAVRWNDAYMAGMERLARGAGLPDPALAADTLTDLIDGALLNQIALPNDEFVEARLRPGLTRTVAGLAAGAQRVEPKVLQARGSPDR